MGLRARLAVALLLFATAVGLVVFVAMAFLRTDPPTVDFASVEPPGAPLHVTVQTVGAIGYGGHPTWVSYLVKSPSGRWVHSTLWDLPENTKIDMTIDEYDSGSPLRNPEIGRIYGVSGNAATLNGKRITLIDATLGNGVAHTFSVPTLGINVPLYGVDGNAKNFCNAAPCELSEAHNVIQFSFNTPKTTGQFPFQCFVPCGLGYLYGNGGPMQTIGYMDGLLKVVPQ